MLISNPLKKFQKLYVWEWHFGLILTKKVKIVVPYCKKLQDGVPRTKPNISQQKNNNEEYYPTFVTIPSRSVSPKFSIPTTFTIPPPHTPPPLPPVKYESANSCFWKDVIKSSPYFFYRHVIKRVKFIFTTGKSAWSADCIKPRFLSCIRLKKVNLFIF